MIPRKGDRVTYVPDYDSVDDTDFVETATGMQIELKWSKDETMVTLIITDPGTTKGTVSVRMSSLDLDELRSFLTSKLF